MSDFIQNERLRTYDSRLDNLEALVKQHSNNINELQESLRKWQTRALMPQSVVLDEAEELEALKALLQTSQWPAAVESYLICNSSSEQDKEDRAEGILDIIIDMHLENLNFLDFGCGEGHVVNRSIMQKPRFAVGYDIVESPRWEKWERKNASYTTNWDEVVKHAPYNVVLLYDVVDHIIGDNAVVENLKKIRNVMAQNGKIFAKCHPWCSRHATHLYHTINKAFIHLVFTPEELAQMGYNGNQTNEVIHPIMEYEAAFKAAGLRVLKKDVINKTIEPFFSSIPVIANRIKRHWKRSQDQDLRSGKKFPPQLEMQFIDFTLGV